MAKVTETMCDLELSNNKWILAEEQVSFCVDGKTYNLDLTSLNAKKFRDAMRLWTDLASDQGAEPVKKTAKAPVAKKAPAKKAPAKKAPASSGSSWYAGPDKLELRRKVRQWAIEQKIPNVGRAGRISSVVFDIYRAGHSV